MTDVADTPIEPGTDAVPGRDAPLATATRRSIAILWVAAIVVAGIGTAVCFQSEPGLNWGIWTTLAGAGALWLAGRRGVRTDPVAVWGVALASIVSWGAAITANDLFHFFIVVSCVTLLATATRVLSGLPGREVGVAVMAQAPLRELAAATVEAGERSLSVVTGLRGERHAATVRGIAIALPIAAVFALILAGADPTLTTWRAALEHALGKLDFFPRLVFFIALGTLVLGAYGLALRPSVTRAPVRPAQGRLGPTERRLIVGAVAAVFGAFLAVQPAYLFRDTHSLRVSGMTYAQYAHEGFVELTFAATLAVVLVIAVDRFTAPGEPGAAAGRWRYWGTLLLVGEVLVVSASAFHRLTLYESAYGYTTLRLYVQAYLVGMAATLLILAREVADMLNGFDARRAARRTALVAMAFLAVFSFANPEGWVVARNMERYRAMGDIDGWYLESLSINAAPAIVAALPELPVLCAAKIRWHIGSQYARYLDRAKRLRWYEWNLRRARGLAAIRAANIESPNGYEGMSGASLCSASPAKHWLKVPPNNNQPTPADTAADSLKSR